MQKILTLAFIVASYFSAPAFAEDDHLKALAEQKAQQVIDACWAISEEERDAGTTSSMRHGALVSANCMEDHIRYLSKNILFKDDPDTQKETEESLQKIHDGVGRLYWHLHNSHEYCGLSPCGTMYTLFHNSATAREMEKILRGFYRKIAEYDHHYKFIDPAPKSDK